MKTIAILLALVAAAQAVSFIDLVREEWDIFKVRIIFAFLAKINHPDTILCSQRNCRNHPRVWWSAAREMSQFLSADHQTRRQFWRSLGK